MSNPSVDRRQFLTVSAGLAASATAGSYVFAQDDKAKKKKRQKKNRAKPLYRISLAQWSLNRRFFGREQPKLDALRKAARSTGNRSLQEEGLVLEAQGVTSLAELKRVLEQ